MYIASRMSRVGHAQGIGEWVPEVMMWQTRANRTHTAQARHNQAIIGRAKKGTAGRGMVRASKEAHVHTKCVVDVGFWLRLCWCRLCVEHAYTVPIAKNAQEGLCLDDPGCGLSAQFGSILVQ